MHSGVLNRKKGINK